MSTDLLATIQAAEAIGCDRSTLSRWVKDKRILPVHELPTKNGAKLFARADVERLAAEYAAEKAEKAALRAARVAAQS